jgi:hypothetical protein
VPIELAATKEVVADHASGKQQNRDGQDYDEQKLYKPKPPRILFFRILLVPIRGHKLLSSRSVGKAGDCSKSQDARSSYEFGRV